MAEYLPKDPEAGNDKHRGISMADLQFRAVEWTTGKECRDNIASPHRHMLITRFEGKLMPGNGHNIYEAQGSGMEEPLLMHYTFYRRCFFPDFRE